ncbi:MAG: tRNA (adenosine(37)-N6)-threonylcarbamoyltransferase complex dimerization subunit type 1 TsaB [Victivallaceae bacterium]|nr:tRNA (adenosine(37)-N6)-threonylcarbamoyltransferase complex dimerization subunit type 1 TsaB [Victivallaceae bacterium]
MQHYSAALDLSGDEAGLAVAEQISGKIIIEQFRPMTGRSSAVLASWIIDLLGKVNLKLADITEWTVGSGPGSFTGMRLAAALVEGFIMGHAVKSRCVPSAIALAAYSSPGEITAVIFDGRNRELLLFAVEHDATGQLQKYGTEIVFNAENAAEVFQQGQYKNITALQKDATALGKIIPQNILDKVNYQGHIPVVELLSSQSSNWNNDLTDLCYIRPAVFTQ